MVICQKIVLNQKKKEVVVEAVNAITVKKMVTCQEIVLNQKHKEVQINASTVNKKVTCLENVLNQEKREVLEMEVMINNHIRDKEMMMEVLLDVKIIKTKKAGKIRMIMEMLGEKAHNKMIKTKIFLKKMVGVIQKVAGEMIIKIRKCKVIIKIKMMKLGATMIIK
jgi:hypothetical protein